MRSDATVSIDLIALILQKGETIGVISPEMVRGI
jgi:hypothetical protein